LLYLPERLANAAGRLAKKHIHREGATVTKGIRMQLCPIPLLISPLKGENIL